MRGHVHRSELHQLARSKATDVLAKQFAMTAGHALFHSIIVHFENDIPIQVEDRWVNPDVAPDYMQQDFSSTTPNEYLMVVAPLESVSYRNEALLPSKQIATMLNITSKEPCLLLHRQTISKTKIATIVTMWHPGQRYQFAGSF